MARYIDAELVPALFNEEFKKTRKLISQGETYLDNLAEGFTEADRVIRKIPTADVAEVKHGHWISAKEAEETERYNMAYCCSVCGHCDWDCTESETFNYCPNCGAKMDIRSEKKNAD